MTNADIKSFRNVRPRTVTLPDGELVQARLLDPLQTLPLVITPAVDRIDLADWANSNLPFIETNLLKNGALLFRGFDVNTSFTFERFSRVVCPELIIENGEHHRTSVSGKIYTPVSYPPDKQLLWHNENSFNHSWPLCILFYCSRPASEGGETPIVDSRKVFQMIDPAVKQEFIEKKVMYLRNYGEGVGLDWQVIFQTKSRAEVEDYCRKNRFEFEWKSGNRLRTTCVRPATVKHPQTAEISWFNQAQHWHISCLEEAVRESLLSAFSSEDLPRNCFYGDGSPIEDSAMNHILDVYRKLEVTFQWEQADILLIDNVLTAHARNPFIGERKLFVAMGNATTY